MLAARTFLRLDRAAARRYLWAHLQPVFLPVLALAIEPAEHARLLAACARHADAPEACVALGLLGTTQALEALHALLSVPGMAPLAARSMHLVTGRELMTSERVVITTPDEDLTDTELADRRTGDTQVGVEAEEAVVFDVAPSSWREVCSAHAARFAPEQRARLGMPLGDVSDAHVLEHERLAPSVQALVAEQSAQRNSQVRALGPDARCVDRRLSAMQLRTARAEVPLRGERTPSPALSGYAESHRRGG